MDLVTLSAGGKHAGGGARHDNRTTPQRPCMASTDGSVRPSIGPRSRPLKPGLTDAQWVLKMCRIGSNPVVSGRGSGHRSHPDSPRCGGAD